MSSTKIDKYFFWVDSTYIDKWVDGFINGEITARDRRYLLVHLLHMRHAYHGVVSRAGEKISKEEIGIHGEPWNESIKYLEENGYFESKKVYDTVKINDETTMTDTDDGDNELTVKTKYKIKYHMKCENGNGEFRNNNKCKPIWIAFKLMDKGCFKELSIAEILALLLAYQKLNLRNYSGINWNFFSYLGEVKTLPNEQIEMVWPEDTNTEKFIFDEKYKSFIPNLLSLQRKEILEWVPLVLEAPEYDPTLPPIVKNEVKPVDRKRVCKQLTENQHIRWILRPKLIYIAHNKMYKEWIDEWG